MKIALMSLVGLGYSGMEVHPPVIIFLAVMIARE
jgi:hypothetical protein